MDPVVAMTQHAYELEPVRPNILAHWSTAELLDDFARHGYRAARLHYMGNPFDGLGPWEWMPTSYDLPAPLVMDDLGAELMELTWTHPDMDLIVVRFTSPAWSTAETGCNSKPVGTVFSDAPYYAIAWYLFHWFGDQDRTIWLADWEGDWQIRGLSCDEYNEDGSHVYPFGDATTWYSTTCIDDCGGGPDCVNECGDLLWQDRARWVKEQVRRRQRAVRAAREAFPDARLHVEHVEIGNFYPIRSSRSGPTMAEIVGELPTNDKPDRFGVSFWYMSRVDADPEALIETLDWIEETTGLPRNRIYVDEIGTNNDDNADRIYNLGVAAFEWGVPAVAVFDWKRTWCDPGHHFGMWDQCEPCKNRVTWCGENFRYYAARDLLYYVNPPPNPTPPPIRLPVFDPKPRRPLDRWYP
jgi:hypothetical protein